MATVKYIPCILIILQIEEFMCIPNSLTKLGLVLFPETFCQCRGVCNNNVERFSGRTLSSLTTVSMYMLNVTRD